MSLDQYDPIINDAANEWNLDPKFLRAILMQENGKGDPRAVSRAGAIGLGQLMPDTAKAIGVTDPTDPVQSIYGAAKYLDAGLKTEGTPEGAALYYHGGPGWRGSYGPESRAYVPGVTAHYQSLSANGNAAPAPKRTQEASSGRIVTDAAPAKDTSDDDPLKLLPPAPKGGSMAPATTGGDDDPLKLLPPAPVATGTAADADVPPGAAWKSDTYNPVHAAAASLWSNVPTTDASIRSALEPTPGTVYSNIFPGAQTPEEAKAGTWHWAMPNMLRSPLLGLATPLSEAGTVDPIKGTYGADPNMVAGALALGGPMIGGLRFGGPMQFGDVPYAAVTGVNPLDPAILQRAQIRDITSPDVAAAPREPSGVAEPSTKQVEAPVPPDEGAGPQPAGAQITPPGVAQLTPRQEAAYRATAEGRKLIEPQITGEVDNNQYIPGISVNAAELEQTAVRARELKEARVASPEATDMAKAQEQRNNQVRGGYWEDTAKSPVDMETEQTAQKADIEADKQTVFAPGNIVHDTTMAPAVSKIDELLAKPVNLENTPLQTTLRALRQRLVDATGADAREMGPEQAWGLRQDIDRMTDKRMQADDPNLHYVGHELNAVADEIDKEIEAAAPGYAGMLGRYQQHARNIEEMQTLQQAERTFGLFQGPTRQMNYAPFQRFMQKVVDRRSTPSWDLNPYKSFSYETMQRLWNLRDDLRRVASAQELARAQGSDTAQNLMGLLRIYGRLGGDAAIHGIANLISPGWGSLVYQTVKTTAGPALAARAAARAAAAAREQMHGLLNPNVPLRVPPGQESPLTPP